MALKVFENDVTEWVIAESPEDATAIMQAECPGWTLDEDEWKECDPAKTWTLSGEFTPDGKDLALTFAQWIERNGRGFLGTTEY